MMAAGSDKSSSAKAGTRGAHVAERKQAAMPVPHFRRLVLAALCFDEHVDAAWASVPEIEADAAVGHLRDPCRDRAGQQVPAFGQHYGVAGAAEAAVEDEFVSIQVVA